MLKRLFCTILLVAVAAIAALGQELPKTIRGYKLYDPGKAVSSSGPKSAGAAAVPILAIESINVRSVGPTGTTFSAKAIISGIASTGTVDFMMFRDIRVNGIAVEISEFRGPLEIAAVARTKLIVPIELYVSHPAAAKAAYREVVESKPRWLVTGVVLVFGKFRKMGFSFKRVVPVRIECSIDNPLPRI